MSDVIFENIRIGEKFLSPSKVTFKKTSNVAAVPILDVNGSEIKNADNTYKFFNTKMILRKL